MMTLEESFARQNRSRELWAEETSKRFSRDEIVRELGDMLLASYGFNTTALDAFADTGEFSADTARQAIAADPTTALHTLVRSYEKELAYLRRTTVVSVAEEDVLEALYDLDRETYAEVVDEEHGSVDDDILSASIELAVDWYRDHMDESGIDKRREFFLPAVYDTLERQARGKEGRAQHAACQAS